MGYTDVRVAGGYTDVRVAGVYTDVRVAVGGILMSGWLWGIY